MGSGERWVCRYILKTNGMKHKLIKSLIAEIRKLREENNSLSESMDYHDNYRYELENRNEKLREENNRIERQRDYERQEELSRQWHREDLINKLERQERLGDEWGAGRTRKELKNSI